ncbi:MAG: sulfur carrier protein ThiS [Bacteroidales bacterium]|jgi:thiamine biosynthesis protein ThiS|nr:sulfur carrier protein ThiS [Bacteroidales bacterium]
MNIIINNNSREVAEGCTLERLIDEIGYKEFKFAVAVNNQVVKKTAWDETILYDGDKVIVIKAVSGG